ncbi:hypothetical protein DL93DRAFT_2086956, partial [Clavulina sp. PMI_390]
MSGRRILYVQGFHPSTKAKDLAYEFEKCVLAIVTRSVRADLILRIHVALHSCTGSESLSAATSLLVVTGSVLR